MNLAVILWWIAKITLNLVVVSISTKSGVLSVMFLIQSFLKSLYRLHSKRKWHSSSISLNSHKVQRYNKVIAPWSRTLPSVVHLDVFVWLILVHSCYWSAHEQTFVTQNHLRQQYHGKHMISVQYTCIFKVKNQPSSDGFCKRMYTMVTTYQLVNIHCSVSSIVLL